MSRSFAYYIFFFFVVSLSVFSTIFSFSTYKNIQQGVSARASDTAELSLSVETSTASCGDGSCNGAETCSTCSADCGACAVGGTGGAGGGGGGGVSAGVPNFIVDKETFNVQIVSGESETNEIVIENTGTKTLTISISVTGIGQYISFNANSVSIAPGHKSPLTFTIDAPEPGVYAGKIILKYQGITREILVLLNVVSEGVLFDATVTVPDLYRVLRPGQRLPTLIELTEVGAETGTDVTMNYIIKDFDGNVHYTESETFYVLGTKSFSKRFPTTGLEPGDYVLGVELTYPDGFATSSAHFRISKSSLTLQTWLALGALLVAVLVVILSIVFFRRQAAKRKPFKLSIQGK